MPSKKNVQDAHISKNMKALHGAILSIVGVMNRPQVDEKMVQEAGITLDSTLFPLLMAVDRLAPVGVVELADNIGRDYTTVSRQIAKLEKLGLIKRQEGETDKRVRQVLMTSQGKTMCAAVETARERIGRAIFTHWEQREFDQLLALLQKFASGLEDFAIKDLSDHENPGK
ncbi:MarR family winged helix-turn-helix transcriptional regulator [Rugamonas apoptosis]|uniref:Winged helix-turn-helix transcriptional regulator n=1 Tax=Rugamonas apoptosis TaxID=2758570 RepID=A0A7W2F6R9_9BURK|nr:MarR family winged helix-turn-helix transcriptional regulator [Rugamonas apoptosis]MBA5686152.1 winged helix-turn-helix transcriptional regulator [Rugamonas apoptosis]